MESLYHSHPNNMYHFKITFRLILIDLPFKSMERQSFVLSGFIHLLEHKFTAYWWSALAQLIEQGINTERVMSLIALSSLPKVFTKIFNLSKSIIPSCLKYATIIPLPKEPVISDLNDYHQVAPTPVMMKCGV